MAERRPDAAQDASRLDGVVIGVLMGFAEGGAPLVVFPGNPARQAVPARTTAASSPTTSAREVALLFEDGDPARPAGDRPHPAPGGGARPGRNRRSRRRRGQRLELTAEREIVLRCGKASITLTRAGKVLIRGAYIFSRSTGVNKIKGGSVQLN